MNSALRCKRLGAYVFVLPHFFALT